MFLIGQAALGTRAGQPSSMRYVVESSKKLLPKFFAPIDGIPYEIDLWNSELWTPEPGKAPAFRLKVSSPAALSVALRAPVLLNAARAFVSGLIEIEGDFSSAIDVACSLTSSSPALARKLKFGQILAAVPSALALLKERGKPDFLRRQEAIKHHYGLPVSFWKMLLDSNLVYSCAYFERPDDTIDAAQCQKLDHICRKLDLRPGERFLDIGCGWGGLLVHACRSYGVRATGLTLSPRQATHASERIVDAGIGDRCEVKLIDYRKLPLDAPFDKIASVGMIEHVPAHELPGYFACVQRHLEPGGLFLNHGIVVCSRRKEFAQPTFLDKDIFPDHYLTTLSNTVDYATEAGFDVVDVENLTRHYYLTTLRWIENLQKNRETIELEFGKEIFRSFQLYLHLANHQMRVGDLNVCQTLCRKSPEGWLDWRLTRRNLYETSKVRDEGPFML